MSEGGKEAVRADEDMVAASEVRRLEERVRDFERMLGRKTRDVEILKEALDLGRDRRHRRIPRETDRRALGAARSNLAERAGGKRPRRGAHFRYPARGRPAELRIPADAPRSSSASGGPPATIPSNAKRVYRWLMKSGLLLARHTGRRLPQAP